SGKDTPPTSAQQFATKIAKKGGGARANVLTAEQRKDIARQAARVRRGYDPDRQPAEKPPVEVPSVPQMPYSMFRGTLKMGDLEMECHVLSDGRRAFTQREMVRVLSAGRESGNLAPYLDRNP